MLFTHIEEDVSFPNPPGSDLDAYVVYVGFDPDSAEYAQNFQQVAELKGDSRAVFQAAEVERSVAAFVTPAPMMARAAASATSPPPSAAV